MSLGAEVPEGWTQRRLGECAGVNSEQLGSKTDPDFLLEYLDIGAIERPGTIGGSRKFRFGDAPSRARRLAQDGDVLVSTVRPYLRNFARIRKAPDNLVVSTGYAVVRPGGDVDGDFLYQYILSDKFVGFLERRMSGSNYPAVTASDVKAYPLSLPPLAQQRKIGAVLRSVDDATEKAKAAIEQMQVVKRGLMQELISRHAGGSRPYIALADIADLRLSGVDKLTTPGQKKVRLCNYRDVYYSEAILDSMEFMEATATETEIQNCQLTIGDVVITKDSETPNDIGVPAVVRGPVSNLICGYHLAILRPLKSVLDGEYLHYALCTDNAKRQFQMYANGITRFALRAGDIKRVRIPLPVLVQQRKIAAVLLAIDDFMKRTKERIEQAQIVKEALMSVLLTGELRVTPDTQAA